MPAISFSLIVDDCLGCCPTCPTTGDLDVVISGYTGCGCFTDNIFGDSYEILSHTDITGAFTIPIVTPGTPFWSGIIGAVEIQKYTDNCVTPDGDPFTANVEIQINCDQSTAPDLLGINIVLSGGPDSAPLFVGEPPTAFDIAISNGIVCQGNNGAIIGTVTVSLP